MLYLILLSTLAFNLDAVKSEQNLQKRSELALANANQALDAARDDYDAGKIDKSKADLEEVGDSVDLAYDSLVDTGKDPHRDSKYFKRAEMRTRELLRRLRDLSARFAGPDQAPLDSVRMRISDIHEKLLTGIMTKRKKK